MSTTYHNGLRLTAHAPDLFAVTSLVAASIGQVYRQESRKIVANQAALVMDVPARRVLAAEEDFLVTAARKNWLGLMSRINSHSTIHDPLRFSIVFGEVSDRNGKRRLAYHFANNPRYQEALMALTVDGRPIFTDYHFQNQSDQPKDVSDAEWLERERDWDEITASDDENTSGTFGHLPGWALADSVENVFEEALNGYPDDVDLNEIMTTGRRLRQALHKATEQRFAEEAGATTPLNVLTPVNARLLSNAIDGYLESREGRSTARPAPLPANLYVPLDDLPEPFVPEERALEAIMARFRNAQFALQDKEKPVITS